jgi:hypothetical protein
VNATIDGVVRTPSAFSNTFGCAPSIMATHEFVVPKSIPITFDIKFYSLLICQIYVVFNLKITTFKAKFF